MRKSRLQKAIHSDEWSEDDRDRLAIAFGKKGRMHGPGPANGWSPKTNRTVFSAYALGLGWQQDNGLLDWSISPAQRWSLPTLQKYCDHLDAVYPKGTRRNRLSGLERAISVLEPEADRLLFINAIRRLGKVHPSIDKELRVRSTIELEDFGDELMDHADAGDHRSSRLASALYRTGLQIGVMADMMNRIGEFTLLQQGLHVYKEHGRWCMKSALPNSSTKRRPRKRFIPARLTHRFKRYMEVHRPNLCRDLQTGQVLYDGAALWVSTRGRPQSETSIRQNICKFTLAKFGEPVNPHAFRYSGITTIAIHASEQMHAAQVVAGHRPGSRTTEENYNKANDYLASRDWNALAEAIRERGLERRRLGQKRSRRS